MLRGVNAQDGPAVVVHSLPCISSGGHAEIFGFLSAANGAVYMPALGLIIGSMVASP